MPVPYYTQPKTTHTQTHVGNCNTNVTGIGRLERMLSEPDISTPHHSNECFNAFQRVRKDDRLTDTRTEIPR